MVEREELGWSGEKRGAGGGGQAWKTLPVLSPKGNEGREQENKCRRGRVLTASRKG